MIDKEKLQEVLAAYKKDFPYIWEDKHNGIKCGGEKYKWDAVKRFQEVFPEDLQNYNGNFANMLKRALEPAGNLLAGGGLPRDTIVKFAQAMRSGSRICL